MTEPDVKQIIVINRGTEPQMRRGKEIAQGSHASIAFLTSRLDADHRTSDDGQLSWRIGLSEAERIWLDEGFRKIVLQGKDETELRTLQFHARLLMLEAHLIIDSGATEFGGVATVTALAIGPDYSQLIDQVTGHLPLY